MRAGISRLFYFLKNTTDQLNRSFWQIQVADHRPNIVPLEIVHKKKEVLCQ